MSWTKNKLQLVLSYHCQKPKFFSYVTIILNKGYCMMNVYTQHWMFNLIKISFIWSLEDICPTMYFYLQMHIPTLTVCVAQQMADSCQGMCLFTIRTMPQYDLTVVKMFLKKQHKKFQVNELYTTFSSKTHDTFCWKTWFCTLIYVTEFNINCNQNVFNYIIYDKYTQAEGSIVLTAGHIIWGGEREREERKAL